METKEVAVQEAQSVADPRSERRQAGPLPPRASLMPIHLDAQEVPRARTRLAHPAGVPRDVQRQRS